jgi:hypothetical protein
MTLVRIVELDATEASKQIGQTLQQTHHALQSKDTEGALDGLVGALGLALQLGPAATVRVLIEAVTVAREMAQRQDADAISALGPALVALTNQVREAGALPGTPVMEAWAAVAAGLGALLGEVGLLLTMDPSRRSTMMMNASIRAALLDDASHERLGLGAWLDELAGDLREGNPA